MIGSTDGITEMQDFIFAAWKASAPLVNIAFRGDPPAVLGYVPEMRFAGVSKEDSPDKSVYWARMSTTSLDDRQATLSTCVQTPYSRRYRDDGLVVVQIFAPLSVGNSGVVRGRLAEIIQHSMRGGRTENGIWFNKAKIVPMPPEDLFSRVNVMCEYQRDEIQ